jgi:hypothetical protein
MRARGFGAFRTDMSSPKAAGEYSTSETAPPILYSLYAFLTT